MTANQHLKQELEAAKGTLAEQRKTIHELNGLMTERSNGLGSQIDQLSKIHTARFDSTDAAADQSKAYLEEKLSALIARNEDLEKVVVALERRVVESVVAEGQKQLNRASNDWQAQFLANVQKHESLVTELKDSYERELLSKTQAIDEKSASIDDLNLTMDKRVNDLTVQVAELRREAEAADKIHREAIHEYDFLSRTHAPIFPSNLFCIDLYCIVDTKRRWLFRKRSSMPLQRTCPTCTPTLNERRMRLFSSNRPFMNAISKSTPWKTQTSKQMLTWRR